MSQQQLSPEEILLLLDTYIANEATEAERQRAEQLIAESDEWSRYVEQAQQLRERIANAVRGISVPTGLAARLQTQLRQEPIIIDKKIETLPEQLHQKLKEVVSQQPIPADLHAKIGQLLRQDTLLNTPRPVGQPPTKIITIGASWQRWYYATAAMILVAVGVWGLLQLNNTQPATEIASTQPSAQLRKVLNIGLDDHIFCAVQNNYGSRRYTTEEMIERLGPYSELLTILRSHVNDWEVVVGHRCHAGNRKFVHLILRKENQIISLAITPKLSGDTLVGNSAEGMSSAQGIPLFQARLQNLQDYEVAGFQTASYFAFIVSQLSTEQTMSIAAAIAPDIQQLLNSVKG